MKLTTNTQVSVDGVMQANGGQVENGKRVLARARRMGQAAVRQRSHDVRRPVLQRADAFLFGRRTYELLVNILTTHVLTGPPGSPVAAGHDRFAR
jgi:hypothetical protein